MGDKRKIDELFSQGLADFEANPGENSWTSISESLAKRRRRKIVAFWRWSATAAALILAFFSGYYLRNSKGNFQSPYTTNNIVNNEDINAISRAREYPLIGNWSVENTYQEYAKSVLVSSSQNESFTPEPSSKAQNFSEQPMLVLHSNKLTVPNRISLALRLPTLDADKPSSLVVTNNIGQENTDITYYDPDNVKRTAQNNMSIKALAAPAFPFREVNISDENPLTASNIKQEELQNSYASGLQLSYKKGKHWEVSAGLMVNHWRQSATGIMLNVDQQASVVTNAQTNINGNTSSGTLDFTTNSGPTDQGKLQTTTLNSEQISILPSIEQNYRFIEVPLSVGYYLWQNSRFSLKVNTGLNSRFLNYEQVELIYADGSRQESDDFSLENFSIQLIAGTGVGYKLSPKLQFSLQPSLLYGLTPVNRNEGVETYFHQFLIYSGLSYRF